MPVTDSSVDFDWFSPEVCRDPQFYDGKHLGLGFGVHACVGPGWRGSRACRCCPRSRGTSRPSNWPASPR
jgi:hypothetical protein